MLIALASEATGFGYIAPNGSWYPAAGGQIFLLYAFTVFFTFLGSYWFGLAFPQRRMGSWMMGALKATVAWTVTIVAGVLIPIAIFGAITSALQNKEIGGVVISPFIAESISGSITFGMALTVVCLIVAFFYTKAADWFLRAD